MKLFLALAFGVLGTFLFPKVSLAQTYNCTFNSATQRCEVSNSTCTFAHETPQCNTVTTNGVPGCSSTGTQSCVFRSTPNTGSTGGGSVSFNQVIDNTLVPLGFKFNSSSTLATILTGLLPILYGLAGFGLLIYLIVSGFSFLTSAGDPKKMEAAKGQITAAVLGFLLIIAAFWITQIVNYIFGLGSGF